MTYQPDPTPNEHEPVWKTIVTEYCQRHDVSFYHVQRIIAIMWERDNLGRSRYKVPLQPYNGRDSLGDMRDEIADTLAYAKVAMIEGLDIDGHIQKIFNNTLNNLEILDTIIQEHESRIDVCA